MLVSLGRRVAETKDRETKRGREGGRECVWRTRIEKTSVDEEARKEKDTKAG